MKADILDDNIAEGSPDLRLDQGFTFQRRNDLKHTAKRENSDKVLEKSSQIPDWNFSGEI